MSAIGGVGGQVNIDLYTTFKLKVLTEKSNFKWFVVLLFLCKLNEKSTLDFWGVPLGLCTSLLLIDDFSVISLF